MNFLLILLLLVFNISLAKTDEIINKTKNNTQNISFVLNQNSDYEISLSTEMEFEGAEKNDLNIKVTDEDRIKKANGTIRLPIKEKGDILFSDIDDKNEGSDNHIFSFNGILKELGLYEINEDIGYHVSKKYLVNLINGTKSLVPIGLAPSKVGFIVGYDTPSSGSGNTTDIRIFLASEKDFRELPKLEKGGSWAKVLMNSKDWWADDIKWANQNTFIIKTSEGVKLATYLRISIKDHLYTDALKKNILSYYLDMPQEVFGINELALSKQFDHGKRFSLIKTKDIKNGYIELDGMSNSKGFTLALFKSDLGPIVAIAKDDLIGQDIKFLLPEEAWKDVTKKIFPVFSVKDVAGFYKGKSIGEPKLNEKFFDSYKGPLYRVVLPRKGTSIKLEAAVNEQGVLGKELATMSFDGKAFKVKR